MTEHKYMLRAPARLIAQAQARAKTERTDLAKVLRLFLELYQEGDISLIDLLRWGEGAPSGTPPHRFAEPSPPAG